MAALSDLTIKLAYCTQVHDVWPFGPLVYPTASDNDKNLLHHIDNHNSETRRNMAFTRNLV